MQEQLLDANLKSILPVLVSKRFCRERLFSQFFYLELDLLKPLFLWRGFLARPPPNTLDPTSLLVLSVMVMTDAYGEFTGPSNSDTLPTLLPDPSISNSPGLIRSAPALLSFTINLPLFARCKISPTSSV